MNMVPSSTSTHSSSGPSSLIPAPPLPRPPNVPGPGSSTMPGHPGPVPGGHPSMSVPPYGHISAHHHHHQQQSHPIGGGPSSGPSYPSMPSSSPSARSLGAGAAGPVSGMHPSHAHSHGPSPSQFHHPLHSPSGVRQQSHHHQSMPSHHQHLHPMHPPQPHHPAMHPPPHHQHQQQYQHYPPQHPPQHPPHNPPQHPPQHPSHHRMPPQSQSTTSGSSSQQPQMYLSNSINGNWQSDKDMDHRREMIQNIVQLLKQRDKNSSQEWLNKLPQMVKQLEVSLYRSAPSFEEYADLSTLKHRLQLLAMEIAKKTHSQGGDEHSKSGDRESSNGRRSVPDAQQSRNNGFPNHNGGSASSRPGNVHHGHRGSSMNTPPEPRGVIRVENPSSMHPPWQRQRSSNDQGSMQHKREGSNTSNKPQVVSLGQINGMMGEGIGPPTPAVGGSLSSNPGSSSNSKTSEKEFEVRIRHKQQRLLLLHHSSKCQNNDGNCPVTPHCADMKRLWLHMAKCEDNRCNVPHCYSSRAILSHYRKCKDVDCQACGPVRETVWKHRNRGGGASSNPPASGGNPAPQSPTNTNRRIAPDISMPFAAPQTTSAPPQSRRTNASPAFSTSPSTETRNGADPKIKHKQQRLLLLRHASKCTAKEGECRKTPHCAEMKRLWKHISECHDKNCKYPHCLSSRYVLMHYRRCKDARCPACAPVRKTIQDSQAPDSETKPPVTIEEPPKKRRKPTQPTPGLRPPVKSDKPVQQIKPTAPTTVPTTSSSAVSKPSNEDLSYSIINNFSIKQIELHLKSLNQTYLLPTKTMKEKCLIVLKALQEHEYFWVFAKPVDVVELGLADYNDIIKKPMDLGTVQKKLDSGQYHSIEDFSCDVRLTFDNALAYNEQGSVVNGWANEMKTLYEEKYEEMLESLRKEEEERKKNERACALCGFEKLQFEPPVFFCNNIKCSSKRIHRNRHFYVGGNNQYNYCSQCYNELDNEVPIELPDMTLKKVDLKKKKNDEIHEENWVQCDVCQRWIHQICGLFNSRQNKDNRSTYSCPKCLLEQRKEGKRPGKANAPTAEDLPRTRLSEWIENYISSRIAAKYRILAEEKSEVEKISFEKAHRMVSSGGKITIRQVTSTDRKLEVREKMRKHYAHKNYPEEFPYRCKCLLVFQSIDGADVILFALYVYEHGKENPQPNQRTVYISYLDSVHYMRPRNLRTFIYHEILIAYLDHARREGFSKAHIWACPPLKGDDYIFYAKPEDQKTPKDKMLTKWYIDMLEESQKRDIVGKVTNMYDLYFASGTFDATDVPYLEGDYFSSEIESIIKDLEEGKGGKNSSTGKKNKKKKGGDKSKSKNGRKGTRSGGLDDSIVASLTDGKANSSGVPRDPVMVKLGEQIKHMKQSFIVAYLNWEGATPEEKAVPQKILEEREKRKLNKENPETQTKKRDANGNSKQENKRQTHHNIINDDTEEISGEIFDTRQDFLNLCKGNHYQFDAPRRAKHTSMMVLWHLHNKNAAKFVQSCIQCNREILSGIRYTCQTCTDVDVCADCYKKNPKGSRGLCTHQLVGKVVETESNKSGSGSNSNLTEKQRKERQKNINLHIKLLEHASMCNSPNCASSNCAKMKNYLEHSQDCKEKMSGGCKICKRIWTLLRYHATSCKNRHCTIPQCRAIRDRIRQIAKQQQAMDDRRRQMINRQYRSSHGSS